MECDTEQHSADNRWDREPVGPSDSTQERWRVTLARQHSTSHLSDSAVSEYWIESDVIAINVWWELRPLPREQNIESKFQSLAKTWRADTEHASSVSRMIAHPSYLAIIKLGSQYPNEVVALILKELRRRPDYWFVALETITGQRLSKTDGDFDDERRAWLKWGKNRGYL